ncbi:MAG: helix-turn-helix domain-containing protein [Calditrichae bacterium]|nr:helix-turn-helix domain-containing protein [Calditrichia bacterium]
MGKLNKNSRLLRAKEAAEYLNISPKTLWVWVRDGKLPQIRINGTNPSYDIRDLDSLIDTSREYNQGFLAGEDIRKELRGAK